MSKLHEILSIEPDKKGTAEKILAETVHTFSKKQEHFFGQNRSYKPLKDDDVEDFASENKEIVTTVRDKLDYTETSLVEWLDVLYQKEQANTQAKSDLVIEGIVVAKDVPATVLLNFEKYFKQIRQIYDVIPTLPPEEIWVKDGDKKNEYRTDPKVSYRTKKEMKAVVLYPHTDKHPAQLEKVVDDVRVGTWQTIKRSGCLSSLEKSLLLGRVDKIIQAVKVARMRANDQKVEQVRLAKQLFEFINNG